MAERTLTRAQAVVLAADVMHVDRCQVAGCNRCNAFWNTTSLMRAAASLAKYIHHNLRSRRAD